MKNSKLILILFLLFNVLFSFSQFEIERISINTDNYSEYSPTVSFVGKILIFESDISGNWKLYESKVLNDKSWSEPSYITEINDFDKSDKFVGGSFLTYNGDYLYFTSDFIGTKGDNDIWYSKRENGLWSKPVNIGEPVNSIYFDGFPSLTTDGNTLYFMRNYKINEKPDINHKGYYIYVSHKNNNGKWSEPELLPEPINQFSEECPRIMANGRTLIFSSIRPEGKGNYDLYKSKLLKNNIWTNPENLTFANTEFDDKIASITASNDIMYYTIQIDSLDDIYTIALPHNFFQGKMILLKGVISNKITHEPIEAKIAIQPDDNDLPENVSYSSKIGFYSQYIEENQIYHLTVKKAGFYDYSSTINLINYKDSVIENNIELEPKVLILSGFVKDDETLMPLKVNIEISNMSFNQNSNINSDFSGKYSTEIRVGSKYKISINHPDYYNYLDSIDISSYKDYNDVVKDIYLTRKKIATVVGSVIDINTKNSILAKVNISRISDNLLVDNIITDIDGKFRIVVSQRQSYDISVYAEGYLFHSSLVQIDSLKHDTIVNLEVELSPIVKEVAIVLNNIQFDFDSYKLLPASYIELDKVVELLNTNPEINIELSAHTCDLGSDSYNLNLSQKRAESAVNYLIEKGIEKSRIIAKGYGETQPKVANISEDNRRINRRVEFKVLK